MTGRLHFQTGVDLEAQIRPRATRLDMNGNARMSLVAAG